MYQYPIRSVFITSIPAPVNNAVEAAANSQSKEMNTVLTGIIIGLLVVMFFLIRYFLKEKKDYGKALREDFAKEQAINEGAHQHVVKSKDEQIKHLTNDSKQLKGDILSITQDNTEVYRQLVLKIGSFVEGQAVVAANQEKNKSEILLEINRLFGTNFRNH